MIDTQKPLRHEYCKSLHDCIWQRKNELDQIVYESLRSFYRDISCSDKEKLFVDLFNDAFSIVSHVCQCAYPSIYFREYENIGLGFRVYNDGFRYGGHVRKGIVMSMAYQSIARSRNNHRSLEEIDTLLDYIEKFSISEVKDFHDNLTQKCDKYFPTIESQLDRYFGQQYSLFTEKELEQVEASTGDFLRPFIIAEGKQTSVLVVLETMYKAKWILKANGNEYTSRDEMIGDVTRLLFNQEEIKGIKQKINSAKKRTFDGQRKYFDELLRYVADDKLDSKE